MSCPADPLPAGQLTVVIGREFPAPAPDSLSDDRDLLRAALDIEDDDVRRRRAAYWRWQLKFLRDGMFVDQDSITAAEEMQDLIADEQRAVRRHLEGFIYYAYRRNAKHAPTQRRGPIPTRRSRPGQRQPSDRTRPWVHALMRYRRLCRKNYEDHLQAVHSISQL